jgi:dihydrolipoamide dehydrogenase
LTVEDVKTGKTQQMEADIILVSTGRRPFTSGLGLENLGIELDKLGRIPINEHF